MEIIAQVEFSIAFMEKSIKRMREKRRRVPNSLLRQLFTSEQELAELKDKDGKHK